jgi:spermidine/putrescine-binding protein
MSRKCDQNEQFSRGQSLDRRDLLRYAGALAATGVAGMPLRANAAPTAIEVLMANVCFNGPLRGIVEREANVVINDGPFQSSTDVVSKLTAPGGTSRYDMMASIVGFSRRPAMGERAGAEKVMPLDLTKIPNVQYVADTFKDDFVVRDGKTYLIPIFFGFDSVIYNRDVVRDVDVDTWGLIFDERFAGKIGWYDVAHQMFLAGGLFLGHKEPERMDRNDLAEVTKFLISKKKLVRTTYRTFSECVNLMASGEIVVSYAAVPIRSELQQKGYNVTNGWPKEGVLSFSQNAYIPKDSKKSDIVHSVINTMLGKEYASNLTKASGYMACSTLGTAELTAQERRDSGYGITSGETKFYPFKFPDNLSEWIEAWSRVKSA